jgi:hypothetical protein
MIVLIISLFLLVSFVKRALWGTYLVPSWKAHILSGVLTAVIGSIIIAALSWGNDHFLVYLISSLIGLFCVAFFFSYALGVLVQKRAKKLADLAEEDR